VRREYLEDAVLVIGGGVVIAAAWIMYWKAGLIVAGLVCMLLALLAYRHRSSHVHHPQPPQNHAETHGAAAWRFHLHQQPTQERNR